MKYTILKNEGDYYKSTGGLVLKIPPVTKTVIYNTDENKIVAYIPDYYINSDGIANGIIKLLNSGKIKLDLTI